MNKKLVFNHFYRLKHDEKRSYILGQSVVDPNYRNFVNTRWASKIHPYFAMIFSFFSQPVKFDIAVDNISSFFEIDQKKIRDILLLLINNEKEIVLDYKGEKNMFPRNVLIKEETSFMEEKSYVVNQFLFKELDLSSERPYTSPLTLVWMANNSCFTDCVYCYADKSVKSYMLPVERVIEFIEEANRLNIADFMITGGEFFLYRNWEIILSVLAKNGYRPDLISTKIPLSENIIQRFVRFDICLQISLDSLDSAVISKILNTDISYLDKMVKTMKKLNDCNQRFQVATVLTKYNDSIDSLENLYTFLSQFSCLKRWEIRVAFKSLYSKSSFDALKTDRKHINLISEWIEKKKKQTDLEILWSPDNNYSYFKGKDGSESFEGNRCSANMYNMVILPDGEVTICEQLYWNRKYLIGNIATQSISDIWRSDRALNILSHNKADIDKLSPCHYCDIYDKCMSYSNRCIVDILKAYGDDHDDYPDPRCERAPRLVNDMFFD